MKRINNIQNNYELQKHFIEFLNDGKREISHEETEARKETLKLDFLMSPYVVVRVCSYYNEIEYSQIDSFLFNYLNHFRKLLAKLNYNHFAYLDNINNIVAVISLNETNLNKFEKDLISIRDELAKQYRIEVHIAVGSVVERFVDISISAHDASEMLVYKYQYMNKGIVNISNALFLRKNKIVNNNIYFERVIGSFINGDLAKTEYRLNELIEQVRNRPNVTQMSIKYTMIELVAHILHIGMNNNINVDEVLQNKDFYSWILEQNHTEVLVEWFMEFCKKISTKMQENIENKEKYIIENTKTYIDENINNTELGLSSIAEHIGLSQSYFSQLFKKETGIGLNVYIKHVRIAYAQKLLCETDLTHEEIAFKSGFTSSNYFHQVFKKEVGVSPGEYRKKEKKLYNQ